MCKFLSVISVLACICWPVYLVESTCNECQSNKVACINQTSFQLCFKNQQDVNGQIFECPEGLVCTEQPNICFQRLDKPASCGDTVSCGLCSSNNVFACTSRSTYSFCFGEARPSSVQGICPEDHFCDASSANFCVTQAAPESIICHLN